MRTFFRTSLLVVMMLMVPMGALGSPGATQRGCAITLTMDGTALAEPIGRWLKETCDLAALTVRCARWDGADSVALSLRMGSVRAFELTLLRVDGVTTLTSGLLDEPVVLPPLCDWAEELFAAAEPVLTMRESGRSMALSGEGLARALSRAAVRLRAWSATARATAGRACEACGECEVCAHCEVTDATAMLLDAVGEAFDEVVDKNVLTIDIVPFDVVELPGAIRKAADAPDELNVYLVEEVAKSILYAMAQNPA